jgi:hypothetical protein
MPTCTHACGEPAVRPQANACVLRTVCSRTLPRLKRAYRGSRECRPEKVV